MSDLQRSIKRNLAHDAFHQRRLSLAVLAHEGHLLTTFQREGHVGKHLMHAIGFPHFIADDGIVA